jgi:drug/metabolite transporter (DMT)-like permease
MSDTAAGLIVALIAAALYAVAVGLQALEARRAPEEHSLRLSLLGFLTRRPLWLLGAVLGFVGWGAQAVALSRAPLTLVEPALAATPVFLLLIASITFRERVELRDVAGLLAVAAGVAGLGFIAPPRSDTHASGARLAILLALLAAATAAPLVQRGMSRSRANLAPIGAGVAYGLVALATKFADDDLRAGHLPQAAAWIGACAVVGLAGVVTEMSALQQRSVTTVAPVVFGLNVLVPVLLAPALAHESWSAAHAHPRVLVSCLIVVLAGMFVVTRSKGVVTLLESSTT